MDNMNTHHANLICLYVHCVCAVCVYSTTLATLAKAFAMHGGDGES